MSFGSVDFVPQLKPGSKGPKPAWALCTSATRSYASAALKAAGIELPEIFVASEDVEKGKPNFKPSGLLAAATNTVRHSDGTSSVLKYNEPPEARKPTVGWRLYVFKGEEQTGIPWLSYIKKRRVHNVAL